MDESTQKNKPPPFCREEIERVDTVSAGYLVFRLWFLPLAMIIILIMLKWLGWMGESVWLDGVVWLVLCFGMFYKSFLRDDCSEDSGTRGT